MKLSTNIKDVFDFIRALASYIGIISATSYLLFLFEPKDIGLKELPLFLVISKYFIAIALLCSPFIFNLWEKLQLRWIILVGKLSEYIIEKQEVLIDIYDQDGKYANYFEKLYFHKFSNKNKHPYIGRLNVGGAIDPSSIQSLNCHHSLNRENNILEISYINKISKLNNIPNLFKKLDKFLVFSARIDDSFTQQEEFWDLKCENLCQDFNLQILLPANKKVKYATFSKKNNPDEIIPEIQPMLLYENDRQKIFFQIMNFDKNESYTIKWGYA